MFRLLIVSALLLVADSPLIGLKHAMRAHANESQTIRVLSGVSATAPLLISAKERRVSVYGVIYPDRFNRAQSRQAQYHVLTWKGGYSDASLIETPVDDIVFHDALVEIGARPGNTLPIEAWTQRSQPNSPAPRQKVTGSHLAVFVSWRERPRQVGLQNSLQTVPLQAVLRAVSSGAGQEDNGLPPAAWTFGGNRDRWWNQLPVGPRPGCILCLYSCPSGKVSNRALSIADYVVHTARFRATTERLPPDGTPVGVHFDLAP